ncbi:hypothetical protein PHYSODRAFT_340697 [Phytophthora sojae]|uniref:Uncharacterized protein n=1 Tax=Phytophthora sojae (strain P6497) TaxID=1094619 RepID=G5AAL1_PHYSP|nr:hypothetical protein PHYSODRAFT_340697 [Phytophthora sojae]EGZ07640.1 hypothetical protein PHYSODRAFT_340697 [Phytophthora sojae]|eukprot:XP_009537206.1 hypothetical protein PHYSODRAFT_340697 [Phytophthora sojae]
MPEQELPALEDGTPAEGDYELLAASPPEQERNQDQNPRSSKLGSSLASSRVGGASAEMSVSCRNCVDFVAEISLSAALLTPSLRTTTVTAMISANRNRPMLLRAGYCAPLGRRK